MPTTTPIAASSNGDNTIVAADATGCIAVLGFVLTFSGSVNAKFNSFDGTTDTALTGLFYGAAGGSITSPALPRSVQRPNYQFITKALQSLQLNLSAGTAVGGYVVWERLSPNA